jgi:type VI secretion system secreted protein Hcp
MNDAFIKFSDGIEGESKDSKHENWIEVHSFSHDMRQAPSTTVSSAGGATTGRVDMGDFTFSKLLDKASPKLYEACCKGIHIKTVNVEFCRASGGDKLPYMKVDMTDVVVSQVSPSAGHGDDFPTELVSLNVGKFTWTYTQQSRQGGGAAGQVSTNWSSQKGASA